MMALEGSGSRDHEQNHHTYHNEMRAEARRKKLEGEQVAMYVKCDKCKKCVIEFSSTVGLTYVNTGSRGLTVGFTDEYTQEAFQTAMGNIRRDWQLSDNVRVDTS